MTAVAAQDAPWVGQTFAPPLPQGLEAVAAALVAHLKDVAVRFGGPLASVEIAHFPDKPEAYRLTHRIGAVLLIFHGAEYTHEPTTIDEVRQERELTWECAVIIRGLGWSYGATSTGQDPGAYGVLEGLRLALSGWQLPGFTKMIPRGEAFVKRDKQGGVWYYQSRFAHRSTVINLKPDEAYPLLTRVDYLEERGESTQQLSATVTFDVTGAAPLGVGNVRTVTVAGYLEGTDYTVDAVLGLLLLKPGGALAVGNTVTASFDAADIVTALASGGPAPAAPTN